MTAMSTPRIAPGRLKELGLINNTISLLAGRVMGGKRPNVFTTLGRQRGLFRAWLWYSSKMMPGGKLPRRETELVILRIATNRECDYEYGHHSRIGLRVGVTTEELDNIRNAGWSGWSAREHAVFAAVDELGRDKDIADHTWTELRQHLNEPETIELLLLSGQYESLATTLMTLRVQPD